MGEADIAEFQLGTENRKRKDEGVAAQNLSQGTLDRYGRADTGSRIVEQARRPHVGADQEQRAPHREG